MKITTTKDRRKRIALRQRKRIAGTAERPRLRVFRSVSHIYAQVIDDAAGTTLASASTLDKDLKGKTGATKDGAAAVGKTLAERAKKAGVSSVPCGVVSRPRRARVPCGSAATMSNAKLG